MGPFVYLNSPTSFTIATALRVLHNPVTRLDIRAVMAVTVVSVISPLVLLCVAQSKYIQGVVVTAVKG